MQRVSGTVYLTSLSWQAGYDSRNRLTSFSRPGSDSRYTYDANSNRLTGIEQATSDTDLDGEFDATDRSRLTAQAMNLDAASNRLLGFTQTLTTLNNGKTKSVVVSPVTYSVDANGALTGDGLRTFEYDGANRLRRITAPLDGESAVVSYLTNGLGQRVFRSEPTAEQTLPNQETLGADFITWLKRQFGWLFTQAAANTSIGTAYLYSDAGVIPSWALLGEYDNGSASGKGRTEYIWLPTEDGNAIPVGILRNSKLYGIHTDHLGTPRVMKNEQNEVVWQWPYSAFGQNKPTGVLKATPNPNQAITNQPVLLKATAATELNLRFPGQYAEDAGGVVYNYFRNYDPRVGRYTQFDPIGLAGGLNPYSYAGANSLGTLDPYGLYSLGELLNDSSNYAAGFGDTVSFGLTSHIRKSWNVDGVNYCSSTYIAGVASELMAELLLTGGSATLRHLASGVSSRAAQRSAKPGKAAFRKSRGATGGEIHHGEPLKGHPLELGGGTALFPTAGLPADIHTGAWNLTHMSRAEHMAAHAAQMRLELLGKLTVNPAATLARLGLIPPECACP